MLGPMKKSLIPLTFSSVFLVVVLPTAAFAYIDPATGSMILQLIFGGIAGLLVITKLYYQRIKKAWSRREVSSEEDSDTDAENKE